MNQLTEYRKPTMSSLELLDIINQARAEHGENPIRSNDFHTRVRDELDGEFYESFVKPAGPAGGRPTTAYRLNQDQCMLVGMRESKSVRRTVLEKLKGTAKPLSLAEQALVNAQALVEQERRIKELEHDMADTKEQVRALINGEEHYTVIGYGRIHGKRFDRATAARIGKLAAHICRDNDWHIGSAPHPNFGEINTYPAEALELALDDLGGEA